MVGWCSLRIEDGTFFGSANACKFHQNRTLVSQRAGFFKHALPLCPRLVSLLRGGGWLEDGVVQAAPHTSFLRICMHVVMVNTVMFNARNGTLP